MHPLRLPLFVVLVGTGCATVQPLSDPGKYIADAGPKEVFVTHKNGAQLTISRPHMSGDTLFGSWQGVAQPLALPLDQLQRVEASQRHQTRTTVLIVGVSVTAVALGYMLLQQSQKSVPCDFDGSYQLSGCDPTRIDEL